MSETLTPEQVIELGQEATRLLLRHLSVDELDKMIAPSYRQRIMEQGVEQGVEQGIAQERKDIVHNMHDRGFDMPTIADVTGLSVEQVQTLLNSDDE